MHAFLTRGGSSRAAQPAAETAAQPAAETAAETAAAAEVPTPAGASNRWVSFARNYAESRGITEIVSETTRRRDDETTEIVSYLDQSSRRELFPQPEPPLPTLRPVPAAAAAPAELSAGVALLRREMVAVKGQPHLMTALEKLVKSAERQKRREAARDAQQPDSAPKPPNLNMVFGGPPGTGKTSSGQKIANVLADPELGVLKHAKVVELNKETTLPKGDTVPQRVGKLFESAKGCILFLDEAHKRTDSRAFVDALLPLLSKYEGEVMVIIAGYKDEIMNWLRSSDRGNPNPNP